MRPLFRSNILRFNSCVVVVFLYCYFYCLLCNAHAAAVAALWLSLVRFDFSYNALHTIIPFLFTRFGCFSFALVFVSSSAAVAAATQRRQDNFSIRPIEVLMYAVAVPGQCVYECLFNRISTRINDTIRWYLLVIDRLMLVFFFLFLPLSLSLPCFCSNSLVWFHGYIFPLQMKWTFKVLFLLFFAKRYSTFFPSFFSNWASVEVPFNIQLLVCKLVQV